MCSGSILYQSLLLFVCAAERERVRDLAASLCRGDFTSVLRSTRNESLLAAVAAAVEAAAEDESISMWGAA